MIGAFKAFVMRGNVPGRAVASSSAPRPVAAGLYSRSFGTLLPC